jgi:hypothetical protein
MNTATRRLTLRVAVGLLAFLIGVSAAWAFGGFNPFHSSSETGYSRHYGHYEYYRSGELMPVPAYSYPVYRKHGGGCRAHGELGKLPSLPPVPDADAPMPPSAPPAVR